MKSSEPLFRVSIIDDVRISKTHIKKNHIYVRVLDFDSYDCFVSKSPIYVDKLVGHNDFMCYFLYDHPANFEIIHGDTFIIYDDKGNEIKCKYRGEDKWRKK